MNTFFCGRILRHAVSLVWIGIGVIPAAYFAYRLWQRYTSDSTESVLGPAFMVATWAGIVVAACGFLFGKRWGAVALVFLLPVAGFIAAGWFLMCLLEEMNRNLLAYSVVTLGLGVATWIGCVSDLISKRQGRDQAGEASKARLSRPTG